MQGSQRVTLRHHLPGRTRFTVSGVAPAELGAAIPALSAAGIIVVRIDPHTGSLLLRHSRAIDVDRLRQSLLAALAGDELPEAPPEPTDTPAHPKRRPVPIVARAPALRALQPLAEEEVERLVLVSPDEALAQLGSRPGGLDSGEARQAFEKFGANLLPEPHGRSVRDMLGAQLSNLPVALLAGSAVLSLATGGVFDAVVTIVVIGINTGIGYATESATERLIRRLSRPVEHQASVLRDGQAVLLPSPDVVPGDVLVLAPGTVVAADARLIRASELSLDESMLTGESLPAEKVAAALAAVPASIGDRRNIVHAGTVVTGGDGLAVVFRSGAATEGAHMRTLIDTARPPRALTEEKLEALSGRLALGCLGAAGVVLIGGGVRGVPLVAALKSAIALAVAAIPEGMPAVATTTLALGARAMEHDNALVRALPAIEAIGAVDTICLDKTGTLTRNEMAVMCAAFGERTLDLAVPGTACDADASAGQLALAEAIALCSEATLSPRGGSATELALLDFAAASGLDVEAHRRLLPVRSMQSRNHGRRFMVTEHAGPAGPMLFVKGAPEEVLALCAREWLGEAGRMLDEARREEIRALGAGFANRGLRVLAAARGAGLLGEAAPEGLDFLGFACLADPIRVEAREAIDLFHSAGIRTIMMTGDHPGTAMAVADALALSRSGVLRMASGADIEDLDHEALGALALETSVFARVSPADKLRIVEALQARGRRVAMLGDGVNDGPALRAASVGVAVGRRATSVAREVADLVLPRDDLRELARAIERGRATGENIRNAIRYLLSTNLSEILVMLAETLRSPQEGETPMELFWLNLVTDILPALGLALAEPGGDVMRRPPREAAAPLFDRDELAGMAIDGAAMAGASLASHFLAMSRFGVGPQTRGATFLTLALAQVLHAFTLRDRSREAGQRLRISEQRLETALGGSLGLLALPFLAPGLRRLLGIAPIAVPDIALSAALAAGSLAIGEGRRIVRKGGLTNP